MSAMGMEHRTAQESFKAAKLPVDAGADLNAEGWEAPYIEQIDEEDNCERVVNELNGTPPTMAIYGSNIETIKCLIQNDASVNLQSDEYTLLFAVLKLLRAHGVEAERDDS
ncbi:hypothetical protein PISL3812_09342 [Talaromyces islandicus]|uniref:Uncharacterized protein n=1 Tax=Talaromyces islandicus TaxID=28573 RepID=A0A0U1M9N6_TALIS|nr:hypothetical protein PISL3812_09342 [Talaromyces islandicus]